MRIEREFITPEMAARYLGLNYEKQRSIRHTTKERYVADMASGNWRETGDTIKFNTFENVIDGQHRLRALISANVSLWFWVARDVPDDAYDVLDQNLRRNFADALMARKVSNYSLVASAVSALLTYRSSGQFRSAGRGHTIPELLSFWEVNRDLELIAPMGNSIYKATRFSASITVAMLYVFYLTKADDADIGVFATGIASGDGLKVGEPTYAARSMLLGRMSIPTSRRYDQAHYCACFVRAWNSYARGDSVVALKGLINGKFPEVFDPHGFLEAWRETS